MTASKCQYTDQLPERRFPIPTAGSILSVESNQNVEYKTKNVESKKLIAFLLQEISYFEP